MNSRSDYCRMEQIIEKYNRKYHLHLLNSISFKGLASRHTRLSTLFQLLYDFNFYCFIARTKKCIHQLNIIIPVIIEK